MSPIWVTRQRRATSSGMERASTPTTSWTPWAASSRIRPCPTSPPAPVTSTTGLRATLGSPESSIAGRGGSPMLDERGQHREKEARYHLVDHGPDPRLARPVPRPGQRGGDRGLARSVQGRRGGRRQSALGRLPRPHRPGQLTGEHGAGPPVGAAAPGRGGRGGPGRDRGARDRRAPRARAVRGQGGGRRGGDLRRLPGDRGGGRAAGSRSARVAARAADPGARSELSRLDPPRATAQRDVRLRDARDRKSTRLNSSHSQISYAVFCLKKKKKPTTPYQLSTKHKHDTPYTTT